MLLESHLLCLNRPEGEGLQLFYPLLRTDTPDSGVLSEVGCWG